MTSKKHEATFEVAKQAEAAGCRLRRALTRGDDAKAADALASVIAAGEAAAKLQKQEG